MKEELDWRKDYLNTKARLSAYEKKLLTDGPNSFMSALLLGVLKRRWLKMRGLYTPEPEPPNCQSSFSEWNDKVKQLEKDYE